MILARNFEVAKTPRESLLTAQDCCPPRPNTATHLVRSVPPFGDLRLVVRSCRCLQAQGKKQLLGVVFRLVLRTPNFDRLRSLEPLDHLEVENLTSVEKAQTTTI